MTATRSAKTRASSTPSNGLLRASTLALAAAIALEVTGLSALDPVATDTAVVASVDGTAVGAPPAVVARVRVPSVGIRIVAQADTPAP